MKDEIIKNVLKMLNQDNYYDLKLGLRDRVQAREKYLFIIEDRVFGNADIQKQCFKEFLKDNKQVIEDGGNLNG